MTTSPKAAQPPKKLLPKQPDRVGQTVVSIDEGEPVVLALIDLDGFGSYNDAHGVDAGNMVLMHAQEAFAEALRDTGILIRTGGDEFAVVLRGHSPEEALLLLDHARSRIASHAPDTGDAPPPDSPVTASVGIAARPQHAIETDDLRRAAEEALYRAKRDGGNRIALYVEEKMVLKSNYYPRMTLDRLAKLARITARTEASLLREALDDFLERELVKS